MHCRLILSNAFSRVLLIWDLSVPSMETSALLRRMFHVLACIPFETFGMRLIKLISNATHRNGHIFFIFLVLINFLSQFLVTVWRPVSILVSLPVKCLALANSRDEFR